MSKSIDINTNTIERGVPPQRFLLWIFIASIVMMFTALTSAVIVRKSSGVWHSFHMSDLFLYSSLIVLLSSVALQIASKFEKSNNINLVKTFLSVTFLLGGLFLITQWYGWVDLVNNGIYLSDYKSVSGSFLYIISGLHGLHIIGGLILLFILIMKLYLKKNIANLSFSISQIAIYWHFVGGLWIYLYLFFLFNY